MTVPIGSRTVRDTIRRNGVTVTLYRLLRTENQGGEAIPVFTDDAETAFMSIRPGETARYAVGGAGEVDSRRLLADVLERGDMAEQDAINDPQVVHPPIEDGDRIIYDGEVWHAVQRQQASKNGFARFVLKEDGRGGSGSDSDDGSDGGDDPVFVA